MDKVRRSRGPEAALTALIMGFSVTVWNMQHRRSGWEYLDQRLPADIVLLQEAALPPSARNGIHREIGGGRQWGSAVLSPHPVAELTEVTSRHTRRPVRLIQQNQASVIAARVELVDDEAVIAVSLYGVHDDAGYAITSVHRALSDLTPLMETPLRHRVIVGGDLNCSSQLRPPYRAWHRNVFDRFAALGLVDLTGLTAESRPPLAGCPCDDEPCRHVQTFRRAGAAPYQDDWLFASARLAKMVESVEVLSSEDSEAWKYSDHAPIRAVFSSRR